MPNSSLLRTKVDPHLQLGEGNGAVGPAYERYRGSILFAVLLGDPRPVELLVDAAAKRHAHPQDLGAGGVRRVRNHERRGWLTGLLARQLLGQLLRQEHGKHTGPRHGAQLRVVPAHCKRPRPS
ncbi:MAG: hypothetical protein ACYS5W_21585, partial [Planctomycetota bacterium]